MPGAIQYPFLMPCGLLRPSPICDDPEGFDRAAVVGEIVAGPPEVAVA